MVALTAQWVLCVHSILENEHFWVFILINQWLVIVFCFLLLDTSSRSSSLGGQASNLIPLSSYITAGFPCAASSLTRENMHFVTHTCPIAPASCHGHRFHCVFVLVRRDHLNYQPSFLNKKYNIHMHALLLSKVFDKGRVGCKWGNGQLLGLKCWNAHSTIQCIPQGCQFWK